MVNPVPAKISRIPEFDKSAPSPNQGSHPLFGAVAVPVPAVKQGKEAPSKTPTTNPLDGATVISA